MRLHPVIHNHTGILWCGHAAMATITGRSTKDCLPYLKQSARELELRGEGVRPRLTFIYGSELLRALVYFGFNSTLISGSNSKKDSIFANTIPNNSLLDHASKLALLGGLYLAIIPNHFVVFQGHKLVDSLNPQGIDIQSYNRNHQPVYALWEITELQAKDL